MLSAQSSIRGSVIDCFFSDTLSEADIEIAGAIAHERDRQQFQIELIASENIVSRSVLEAQGSVMTNKYAEGYPGRRYYGGCEFVDVAEALAIDRAACQTRRRAMRPKPNGNTSSTTQSGKS